MNIFPLQNELIDAVIGFANAKLREPKDVEQYFNGAWRPGKLPDLRACRKLQGEVRRWLLEVKLGSGDYLPPLYGIELSKDSARKEGQPAIKLKGYIYIEPAEPGADQRHKIAWRWEVSEASLRSICGLAVATVVQEGHRHHVHECERDECENLFIDRHSRGIPRRYCKTADCDNARNRQAVKKSNERTKKKAGKKSKRAKK